MIHFFTLIGATNGLAPLILDHEASLKLPRGKSLRVGAAARRALRQLRLAVRKAFLTQDYPMCTANVEKSGQLHRGRSAPTLGHWRTGLLKNLLRLVCLCNS